MDATYKIVLTFAVPSYQQIYLRETPNLEENWELLEWKLPLYWRDKHPEQPIGYGVAYSWHVHGLQEHFISHAPD